MEAKIKGYRFKLISELVIAVYDTEEEDDVLPVSYIHLKTGDVRNMKDFHYEIMDWYNKHIGV